MATSRATLAFCVDVGSTFTKAALVDLADGAVGGTAATPTTLETDVLDGVAILRGRLGVPDDALTLMCSSAGGGLRLAVVGYERTVTAEAGFRVGLSAGAKVVHVDAGLLDPAGLEQLRAAAPDIVLLVGGTDGGNADVLLHNAREISAARLAVPVVVAGNAEVAGRAVAILQTNAPAVLRTDNVLPRIGVVNPEPARRAIREVFLQHVIGGKGLSSGPTFASLVRAPTPDAMLAGVEVLGAAADRDILVVDVGGATTDVYSCLRQQAQDVPANREVVALLWHARTVEADLGMRWNALGVLEAAAREALEVPAELSRWADQVHADPGALPSTPRQAELDAELARIAAVIAVRRHGRPAFPGEPPRPLGKVSWVVGSGGVLRYGDPSAGRRVLEAVASDHAGGWRTPAHAEVVVDRDYLLFAVGLLAGAGRQETAVELAGRVLSP